uniref:Adenosine 3'-phospho 5'-phosphosulfate transporter 1 n=1 Tax=Globodera pallida TaxID=36090 RepID=A0A183BLK5_GLOPA
MLALLSTGDNFSTNGASSLHGSISSSGLGGPPADVFWLFRLLPTLAGYGTLLLLGRLLIQCVHKSLKQNEHVFRRHCLLRLVRLFAVGQPEHRMAYETSENGSSAEREQLNDADVGDEERRRRQCAVVSRTGQFRRRRFLIDCLYIFVYFTGIQVTLVCMGFFQERIVTRGYRLRTDQKRTHIFRDTQFLVFANRILALALSGAYLCITWKRQPLHVAPLYLHSFASFSNVLSSWCQYEALKYVSFPAQTVCKASKIVPTMLMGKLLRAQRYSVGQCLFALALVLGTSLFFLSTSSDSDHHSDADGTPTTRSLHEAPTAREVKNGTFVQLVEDRFWAHSNAVSGLILMLGYLLFDAFTPNWQKKLLEQPPRISCSQLMFGVNAFSVLLCLVTLVQQWTLASSIHFLLVHESILADCLFLSVGSAFGQVFIYMTIQHFGPVVLSVMMTLRQIFSIILSSVYFVHPINFQGICGLSLVFGAIFVDIYGKFSKSVGRRRKGNVADN